MCTTLLSKLPSYPKSGREKKADSKLQPLEIFRYLIKKKPKKCLKRTAKMSSSSSPLIVGDGDLIIEEVPMDEDEEAMPPPGPVGQNGPPNACIIRLDSAAASEASSWARNPAHFPPPPSSSEPRDLTLQNLMSNIQGQIDFKM